MSLKQTNYGFIDIGEDLSVVVINFPSLMPYVGSVRIVKPLTPRVDLGNIYVNSTYIKTQLLPLLYSSRH